MNELEINIYRMYEKGIYVYIYNNNLYKSNKQMLLLFIFVSIVFLLFVIMVNRFQREGGGMGYYLVR
jgi:hypothetical protein